MMTVSSLNDGVQQITETYCSINKLNIKVTLSSIIIVQRKTFLNLTVFFSRIRHPRCVFKTDKQERSSL